MPNKTDYFEHIINNVPHFLFWKDRNSTFLGCNERFAKSAGLKSAKEIVGKTDFDMPWSKEESEAYRADDKQVMASKKAKLNIEETQTVGDKHITLLTSKVPLFDEEGEVAGVLGIYSDITERKQMEESLRAAKEMAEVANRSKTEFIHNMEHDIRTPFTGVWSLANELWQNETDAHKKEYLGYITQSAKELMDYCNNILDLSKIESGKQSLIAKKFDIKALVNKIITLEKPAAIIKKINLIQQIEDSIPDIIIGDSNRIERILINLVSNAIKFTSEGYVKIKVDIAKQEEDLVILHFFVEDTGMGIPEEKQGFIYEKFTRGTPSNQGVYKGSGLGLYVVKQLVEDVKGEIDLVSEINKGTKFICTIPFKLPLVAKLFS